MATVLQRRADDRSARRSQVPRLLSREIDLIDVPLLVAVAILEVENVRSVALPSEQPDPSSRILADHLAFVIDSGVERPHPEPDQAIRRSQIRESGPIWREPRLHLVDGSEQVCSGNQWWEATLWARRSDTTRRGSRRGGRPGNGQPVLDLPLLEQI